MNGLQRSLTLLIAAVGLAACGGGGPSASVPAAVAPASAGNSSANRTPVGTATLTLKASAGFHTAKVAKRTSASSRRPAYVNSNANYLDVWVVSGGFASHVVDSSGGSNVTLANGDGTQTYSIPLYSASGPSYIVAYETDAPFAQGGNTLAVGETDLPFFTPGTAPQLSLTMLMAASAIGITDQVDNTDFSATTAATPSSPFNVGCCSAAVYFFASDIDGGFVDLAGVGGVSPPVVTSVSIPRDLSQGAGLNGGYTVSFGSCAGGLLSVSLTAGNPAFAIANDAFNNSGNFRGADFLYQSGSDPTFTNAVVGNAVGVGATITTTIGISANNSC